MPEPRDVPGRDDADRDDLGTWLSEPVRPLLPPAGTFERITKRARRRKVAHAALSAAAVAVVVAAAVSVPRFALPSPSQAKRSLISAGSGPTASPHPTHPAITPAAPTPTTNSPSFTASQTPRRASVPAAFQVSSVTFVGQDTGWVIGQAGTVGACSPNPDICTSIARTDDAGRTWRSVGPPASAAPNGSYGVSQIRFLNRSSGWAFGPELWATHDSGHTWRRIPTHGLRVIALETRADRAFAVWARCAGILTEFAWGCTSFYLYSTPAGSDHWTRVLQAGGPTVTPASSALLVLTGTQGYLLGPSRELLSGPVTSATGWGPVTSNGLPVKTPCAPGPPLPSGQPSGALFASTGSGLVLACLGTPAGDRQTKAVYYSPNGGASWQTPWKTPRAGIALSLSGTPSGSVMLATDRGIEVADAVGGPWWAGGGTMPRGGFTYVGMTTSQQGVAIPADPAQHAVWMTRDYGRTWVRTPVRSAPS